MTNIFKTYSDFLQREHKLENGVSEEFSKNNPDWKGGNKSNEGCWNCSDCSDYKNAAPIKQGENSQLGFKVPIIENIHQKVLEAVSAPEAFDMSSFHRCDTTHCRAGWVIHLAGEPGYELERKTDSVFAAMQIYHKSSPDIPISPVRFFGDNNTAMADIKKCAEKEKELVQ